MNKIILAFFTLVLIQSNLLAKPDGKQLYIQKCAICHLNSEPSDKSILVAPPISGVMMHLAEFFSEEEMQEHINDFVMDPSPEEAICKSVKRFGVMPSQKGLLSIEELEKIAQYMMDELQYSPSSHKKTH